ASLEGSRATMLNRTARTVGWSLAVAVTMAARPTLADDLVPRGSPQAPPLSGFPGDLYPGPPSAGGAPPAARAGGRLSAAGGQSPQAPQQGMPQPGTSGPGTPGAAAPGAAPSTGTTTPSTPAASDITPSATPPGADFLNAPSPALSSGLGDTFGGQ